MKNRYRIIAIILVLILLLTGCTITPVVTDPTTTGNSGTTQDSTLDAYRPTHSLEGILTTPSTSDSDITISCQHLPETVENPDDLPILKWICMPYERTHVWTEEAVHELNQMLADRDMPFRIQFIILTGDKKTQDFAWSPIAQEALKDADLIFGNFTDSEMLEFLSPITQYVTGNAEPTLKNAVVHDLNWLRGSVDGEIYGIDSYAPHAYCNGWWVDPAFMTEYGLTVEDFSGNFWEMDEIFAKIYQENGNQAFLLTTGDGVGSTQYTKNELESVSPGVLFDAISCLGQEIGSCFSVDCSSGTPTVVNKMETDTVRNIWKAFLRYKTAGYVLETNGEVERGTIPVEYARVAGNAVYEAALYSNEIDRVCIPVTDVIYTASRIGGYMNGVAAVSQHKEEAVALLSLIAEDEAFRNQLLFGKEGRDYATKNGYYASTKQADGACYSMAFLSQYAFFSDMYGRIWSCSSTEGEAKLQAYRDMLDSTDYICYPIAFDYTSFEEELIAIAKISNEYYYDLTKFEGGEPVITEEIYDQMLQEFKDAGSEKIIAELQRQLDEWLAANPDWPAQYG